MRITNTISSLEGGGAERVLALLSNLWVERGMQVSVVVRSMYEPDLGKSALDPAIPVTTVIGSKVGKKWPLRTKSLGALLALRSAIVQSSPDVVIAFMDTVAVDTLLATIGTGIPVIVAERCDPNSRPIGAVTVPDERTGAVLELRQHVREKLRQWLYPRAAAVVCQTDTAMSFFSARIRHKGRIIPNPVLSPGVVPSQAETARDIRRIVYLGRLSAVKGLDRLLKAYAKLATHHDGWRLELWGEGPEDGALKQLATELDITDRILFGGWTDSPSAVLQGAKLFVMSSYTEGFPNSLCEAMACGVPPVSFDCPSGPRHIIRHDIDGLLVRNGDIDALALAMDHLMRNEDDRARLASRAPEVLERFGSKMVLAMWEELFQQVTMGKSRSTR